ncbi:hypothetical protein D3C87_956040 [compost metagenome]
MALASSSVSSLLQIMKNWMPSAMISSTSYRGMPSTPPCGTTKMETKNKPANMQARASLMPKYRNSTIKRLMPLSSPQG